MPAMPPDHVLARYLRPSAVLDFDEPAVASKAATLMRAGPLGVDVVERMFLFVRDHIRHSVDAGDDRVTLSASQVLREGTGLCYAKSHLLAALLRASGFPAGLCYQRLRDEDAGPGRFCLHGLVAVYLPRVGWQRLDARGNNERVSTVFRPGQESLAFMPREPGELDLPQVFANPMPCVVAALSAHANLKPLLAELPDVVLYAG